MPVLTHTSAGGKLPARTLEDTAMKLYEITRSYLAALDVLTDPDVDIPAEAVADTLEAIEVEFETKAVNTAAFAKQMEAEAEAIKAAVERMEKRRKALEARAKWLKDYVKIGMETIGYKKLDCPWFVLAVQKNPASVDVFDYSAIPAEFMRIPEPPPPAPDKVAIKAALAAGREVPGARIVNGTRLAIK